jgi:hypothetical protein
MWKKWLALGSSVVIVVSVTFVVNQTAQIVSLANTISPVLGRVTLAGLLAFYAAVLLVPVTLFFRMPKPMSPPADEKSPEYQAYLLRLGRRLATNPSLASTVALNDRTQIEGALRLLDSKADEAIKKSASILFVSTAVSQNGRLDALMVLAEQTRLIWRVAHIYDQRPALRNLGSLYANVGATLFAANALEDMDIGAQVTPVIQQAVGHLSVLHMASLVPGLGQAADKVTDIVINAVIEGTANAYLTLRVGIICKVYCRAMTTVDRTVARRSAAVAAAAMLGSVVGTSAAAAVKAIVAAAGQAGESAALSAATGVRSAVTKLNPFKGIAEK